MPDHTHARIGRQHTLDTLSHRVSAVGDCDLPGVQRVPDAHAAAVVDRNPGRARGSVNQSIQQWPVSDRIAAVFHTLRLAKRRCDRTAIEMIAPNHYWRFDLALLYQVVDRQPELRAFTVSQPADASGQSLKLDSFARQFDPPPQAFIFGEQLQYQIVRDCNV